MLVNVQIDRQVLHMRYDLPAWPGKELPIADAVEKVPDRVLDSQIGGADEQDPAGVRSKQVIFPPRRIRRRRHVFFGSRGREISRHANGDARTAASADDLEPCAVMRRRLSDSDTAAAAIRGDA